MNGAYKSYDTMYNIDYKEAKEDSHYTNVISMSLMGGLVLISMIHVYFSTRSKMISKIYDIGLYRAIGAKRSRIILKYIIYLFILSTFTTLLGYIIFTLLYGFIALKINELGGNTPSVLNQPSTYLFMLGLYVLNIFIGILPILTLLRKTPSEIISKYDI